VKWIKYKTATTLKPQKNSRVVEVVLVVVVAYVYLGEKAAWDVEATQCKIANTASNSSKATTVRNQNLSSSKTAETKGLKPPSKKNLISK